MRIRATYQYLLALVVASSVRAIALSLLFPPHGWQDLEYGFELGRVAANIADGRGMSSPFEEGSSPTSWFMPAAPLLWAALFKLFGTFSDASLVAVYALDSVLAGATACCWLWLLRSIVPNGSQRALPLAAVLIATVVPEHFVALTRPWYWGLQKLGVALMLVFALRWHRSPSLRGALGFGVASGATLLVNSVPLLLFLALLVQSVARSKERRRAAVGAAAALLACGAMLLPWVARNYQVHGGFVPLRQNTWVEIRQGNNPKGSIIQGLDSLHPNVNAQERALYREMGERAYEANARTDALAYMEANRYETAQRTAMRTAFFWLSDLFHEGVYGDRTWAEKSLVEKLRDVGAFLAATVPLTLAILALTLGWLREVQGRWLLTTPLLVLPLPYYISHIHPTYFTSVKALLIVVAVLGIGEAKRLAKGRKATA